MTTTEPSSPRAPHCPHVERCAGCTSFGAPLDTQLSKKLARVAAALGRHRELGDVTIAAVESREPRYAYRPRAKWVVGPKGEVGLFAKGSDHEVLDLPSCQVVEPAVMKVGSWIRSLLRGAYQGLALRAVDVRATASGETLVTLGIPNTRGVRERAVALAKELHQRGVAGVAVSEADPSTPRVVAGRPMLVAGADALADDFGGTRVLATFGGFVQSHRAQALALADATAQAVEEIGPRPRVLELFAGSGALGLAAAARGADVTFVESFAPSARRIEEAASRRGLTVSAHGTEAAAFLETSIDPWDAIIVDPPRRGLEPSLRLAIASQAPQRLVYASCEPETWARDAAHFIRLGMRLVSVRALDMMPHTDEVELVAVFEKVATPAPAEISAQSAVEDVPPHGAPSSRARRALPSGASGLVVSGDAAATAAWEALALVRGVPRAKGRLTRDVTYRRVEVCGGYGLVHLTGKGSIGAALAGLSKIGHPVVGGQTRRDDRTSTYLFEKHGLDRMALHVDKLTLASGEAHESPLPGDLDAVLASLRAR